MKSVLRRLGSLALPALLIVDALAAQSDRSGRKPDPLAAEIARWTQFLRGHAATGEDWDQIKRATEPALTSAQKALARGHRWFALQRLGAARAYLAASQYAEHAQARKPAAGDPAAGVEAEWKRLGGVLAKDLAPPPPGELSGVEPAAVRAIAEAALPQVRAYYESSLEYGRATMPKYGFLYLGLAQAQRDFALFCRTVAARSGRRAPALRGLGAELDALEAELLAAYRPPASIDKHSDFIAASDALKEARELDAAGLRYGALSRYLLADQRLGPLRPSPRPPLAPSILEARFRSWEDRLSQGDTDHSIGRLFLEAAESEVSDPSPGGGGGFATVIVEDVLPAMSPPSSRRGRPDPGRRPWRR